MKQLLPLALIATLVGCNSETEKRTTQTKLENFIDSFTTKHPNWNQNDVIEDSVNKILEKEYLSGVNEGLLSDFPLVLKSVENIQGKYIAHLTPKYDLINKSISFDVLGEVGKEAVDTLKNGEVYSIVGEDTKDARSIQVTSMLNTPLYRIKEYESSFGVSCTKIKQIIPYRRE